MEITQFKKLLTNEDYLNFEAYIKSEIQRCKDKASESITLWLDKIDVENANRAKFWVELIQIPHSKVQAGKMGENKSKL